MENRYESGQLCIGRKGCYEFLLKVHGIASHPGHAYDEGRNAIEEMSHKVLALQAVTPKEKNQGLFRQRQYPQRRYCDQRDSGLL